MKDIFKNKQIAPLMQQRYRDSLHIPNNCEPRLASVITDTLAHPGSLTRAGLAYQILINHPITTRAALPMAIGIEYFHTASLLLDDLPCMDDAITRRGQICPHRAYGEAACILGALAFINRAYALIWQAMAEIPEQRKGSASNLLERCLGVAGVINGQSLDIHFSEGCRDEASVAAIARGKTVALIQLTLVVPGLIAGVSAEEVCLLESLADNWGSAYQLLDDLKDVLHDQTSAKTTGRDVLLQRPNMVACVGLDGAWLRLEKLLAAAEKVLKRLRIIPRDWAFLRDLQEHLLSDRIRLLSLSCAA